MSVVRQNSRGSDLFFTSHIIAIDKLTDEKPLLALHRKMISLTDLTI